MNERELSREYKRKPYVVSGDIQLALKPWAIENGFVLPNNGFFQNLRRDFSSKMRTIFPTFELVNETILRNGATSFVETSPIPIVSLDPLYLNTENQLMMTRTVDEQGIDRGLRRRDNSPTLLRQIRGLKRFEEQEIALFDDVGFSGDMLVRLTKILSKIGVSVTKIYLGIGVGEAINKLQQLGITTQSVRMYPDVIDEICERDFYPGVPQSGRTFSDDSTKGFPYILPFGNPEKWASIPAENVLDFSIFCLSQSITLFEEIERRSGKVVKCCNIQKKIVGIPEGQERFVDELRSFLVPLMNKKDSRNVLE